MKMAYEYTQVTQVFSFSNLPACWIYPVSLLEHAFTQKQQDKQGEAGVNLALYPNYPTEELLQSKSGNYYTELVQGKEYQTNLPTKSVGDNASDSDSQSMLSESTLSLLQKGNLGDDIQKMNVWAQDDISPTSLMFNYKSANAILLWTPYATTRLLHNGEEAEVILHQDNTVLHLREKGNFIT